MTALDTHFLKNRRWHRLHLRVTLSRVVNSSPQSSPGEVTKQYAGFFVYPTFIVFNLVSLFLLERYSELFSMMKTMSKAERIFFCILGIASTFFSATIFLTLLSMCRPPFNSNVTAGTNESER